MNPYTRAQSYIRDLLQTDESGTFESVQILIEDKAGLEFMLGSKLGQLSGPVITITTLTGTFDNRFEGAALETARLSIQHHARPLMDKTAFTYSDRISKLIQLLFLRPANLPDPPQIAPDGACFQLISHTDISSEPGVASHELVVELPLQHLIQETTI